MSIPAMMVFPELTQDIRKRLAGSVPEPYTVRFERILDGFPYLIGKVGLAVQFDNHGALYEMAFAKDEEEWSDPQMVEFAIDCLKNGVARSLKAHQKDAHA